MLTCMPTAASYGQTCCCRILSTHLCQQHTHFIILRMRMIPRHDDFCWGQWLEKDGAKDKAEGPALCNNLDGCCFVPAVERFLPPSLHPLHSQPPFPSIPCFLSQDSIIDSSKCSVKLSSLIHCVCVCVCVSVSAMDECRACADCQNNTHPCGTCCRSLPLPKQHTSISPPSPQT